MEERDLEHGELTPEEALRPETNPEEEIRPEASPEETGPDALEEPDKG